LANTSKLTKLPYYCLLGKQHLPWNHATRFPMLERLGTYLAGWRTSERSKTAGSAKECDLAL
jgi:hypothetical protein